MLDHKTKAMDPRFGASHDDIISFNTQASSQWDGYRNFFCIFKADARPLGTWEDRDVL